MNAAEHDRWADSVAAFLLGALPESEKPGFERHLDGCAVCREEVDRLQVAADALGASAPQLEPPPELKDRLMAIVRSEAELLQAAGSAADRADRPAERRRRSWWRLRPQLALAGAAAVLVLGVIAGVAVNGGLDGSATRTVAAQVTAPDADARLLVRDDGHSTLETHGLPRPGMGRVYQVWVKPRGRDPQPTDALFSVRADGSATVDVPGSLDDVEAVMVTSEPDGGSPAPTTEPVVVASLT